MSKHIKCNPHGMQRQRGAVALIVAICLVLLVGMLGLVLDLGHLYVTRTELQNAADSSSLSGAREFNGKVTGINNAITRAIEAAGKNKFNLNSTVVTVNASNMWVGSCPADGCMVPISSVTSDALAADKTFLKVDTGLRTINTWFIQALPGVANTTQTFGMAVAGKFAIDITPIAICQIPDPGTVNEFGYERGVSYKVSEANPIGPGTMFWIDPESNAPGVCPATSTNATLPYVCAGKIGFTPVVGGTVNTNTGISVPQLSALDSRFGDYTPQNKCDVASAPPDTNVKEYRYNNGGAGSPRDWMGTDPTHQTITFVQRANVNNLCGQPSRPCMSKPYSLRTGAGTDYGVLWAGFRRAGATVSQWPTLYPGNTATSYPEPSPYAQTSGNFFTAPPVSTQPGKAGRRVLNMVIVDCTTAGGVCRPAPVLAVGRFLMQRRSDVAGDRDVFVEFGGLLPTPLPTSDIKLYR